jgi:hypothetical protein
VLCTRSINLFYTTRLGSVHGFSFGKPFYFWSWDIIQGMVMHSFIRSVRPPYFHDNLFQCAHAFMKWSHWPLVTLLYGWYASSVAQLFCQRYDKFVNFCCSVGRDSYPLLYSTSYDRCAVPALFSAGAAFMYGMAMFLLNVVFKTLCKKWRQVHSTPIQNLLCPLRRVLLAEMKKGLNCSIIVPAYNARGDTSGIVGFIE